MTFQKALKYLSLEESSQRRMALDTSADAIRLAIEAIKRIQNIRTVGNEMPGALLPGETEE